MYDIKITGCESGDWEILEVNGEEYASGHSINQQDWIRLLKDLGCNVNTETISDEEMEELC